MTIHTRIKQLREARGWSHQRLAEEVTKLEGGAKTLAWQTVQQWEGATAPKRSRLKFVAQALGTTVSDLVGEFAWLDPATGKTKTAEQKARELAAESAGERDLLPLSGDEIELLAGFRLLKQDDQAALMADFRQLVQRSRPELRAFLERYSAGRRADDERVAGHLRPAPQPSQGATAPDKEKARNR